MRKSTAQYESIQAADLPASYAQAENAILWLDRAKGTVLHANACALALLNIEPADLRPEPWWSVLGEYPQPDHPLSYAFEMGARVSFPPTAIVLANGAEIIVAGSIAPFDDGAQEGIILSLRQTSSTTIAQLAERIQNEDTVAILGVDRISYGPEWSLLDTSRFVMDLRSSLLEIVRSVDLVSLPQENFISMVLPGVATDEALNVTNAFLSHLRLVHQHYGPVVSEARFCVGISQRQKHASSLATFVAANNALLCAQRSASEFTQVASRWDKNQLCGNHNSSDGAFIQSQFTPDYEIFRTQLSSMEFQTSDPNTVIQDFLSIVLHRGELTKVALFRRRKDGRNRYIAGLEQVADKVAPLKEAQLSRGILSEIKSSKRNYLQSGNVAVLSESEFVQPLVYRQTVLGLLALEYGGPQEKTSPYGTLDIGILSFLANSLPALKNNPDAPNTPQVEGAREATPLDAQIEGYVVDNMEGAVDQATFLAKIDMPVAIIGPRGTGKMYVARIIHQESGGAEGMLESVDCREFRSRDHAIAEIAKTLESSAGKTLVFKSPHLMSPDAQIKLARQLSTRTLADVKPARYLPAAKYVALFPDSLEQLVLQGGLTEKLASVFSGYPINVPSVKDRKQAVLRWAHKILGQESAAIDRPIKGFTPDAEQALLAHEWPGNISEMRRCIVGALERTDKEWITPVDLGIFKGISAQGSLTPAEPLPFLSMLDSERSLNEEYLSNALDDLNLALGEVVSRVALEGSVVPLGSWLEDELVLAVTDRYQGDFRLSAEFLHTKPRNISRWMPKIQSRSAHRNTYPQWREPRRIIGEWVRETGVPLVSPVATIQNILIKHIESLCEKDSIATRAKIMAVSVPTYQKRLRQASLEGSQSTS